MQLHNPELQRLMLHMQLYIYNYGEIICKIEITLCPNRTG